MSSRELKLDELPALVGQELAVSDWLTVTQERINQFADATGDHQWIHVDPSRGPTIAHGFLTLSLLSQLHLESIVLRGSFQRILNYGLNRVRFPAAVPAGSKIRSRSTLLACEPKAADVQVTWQIEVEVEGAAKPALVAEWILRYVG